MPLALPLAPEEVFPIFSTSPTIPKKVMLLAPNIPRRKKILYDDDDDG
jgi:hypothetical protein